MKNAIVGAQNATTQAVNTNTAIAKAALNDQQRKELEERRRRMVEQAQDIFDKEEGFRLATPKEVQEFYH